MSATDPPRLAAVRVGPALVAVPWRADERQPYEVIKWLKLPPRNAPRLNGRGYKMAPSPAHDFGRLAQSSPLSTLGQSRPEIVPPLSASLHQLMKLPCVILSVLAAVPLFSAQNPGQRVFEDDFARTESQEKTDEPGNGWATNSKSRAKGNKQVDLRDGAMYIFTHAEADHAASVTNPAEFTDGTVTMRFMLEDARDSLGLNFADLQYKEVHAGHLFAARISAKDVVLQDLKTGNMRLDIRATRQAKRPLTEEQQAALKGKNQSTPHQTPLGKWHEVQVTVKDDGLSISIDGQPVASLTSPGIAHPTKRMLRLAVPRN